MTNEEIYQNYDGMIPDDLRRMMIHGGIEEYCRAFLITAERNFSCKFLDILRSVCIWRKTTRYPFHIQTAMLAMLSRSLFQARGDAFGVWSQLPSNCSASAVMAPPIKTA